MAFGSFCYRAVTLHRKSIGASLLGSAFFKTVVINSICSPANPYRKQLYKTMESFWQANCKCVAEVAKRLGTCLSGAYNVPQGIVNIASRHC
jgi:hypothetical protein